MQLSVTRDVTGLQVILVNLFFVGERGRPWVLVDAGLPYSAGRIRKAAAERFGADSRPEAIVLTHGHFDHVGSLRTLADHWDVPVYAHRLELPYITGRSAYPPPDPTVGGGSMSLLSPLFPKGPIDLSDRARELPEDHSVPGLPGWRWVHTPGHTAGHVSLFHDRDRTLIAGDAFITTQQESFLAVMTQRRQWHGPPMYFTSDWEAARRSVQALAALEPNAIAPGHGVPLHGDDARNALRWLAAHFDEAAKPSRGRYVNEPAYTDERGVQHVPPPAPLGPEFHVGGVLMAAAAGWAVSAWLHRRTKAEERHAEVE